ncbi:MAG: hypothetical protein ABIV50_07410 [Opitutus sp.]
MTVVDRNLGFWRNDLQENASPKDNGTQSQRDLSTIPMHARYSAIAMPI